MKKLTLILAGAIAALALVGCNTVEGIGKDIKASGRAIERAAQ